MDKKIGLLEFCRKHREVMIYGAGEYGIRLKKYLEEAGVFIQGYLVSASQKVMKVEGISVFEIGQWVSCGHKEDTGILVAVSSRYTNEILQTLFLYGWKDFICVNDEMLQEVYRAVHPIKETSFLRDIEPISRLFGFERGTPIDRYYIEKFLAKEIKHLDQISRTIEVGELLYSDKYARGGGVKNDILQYEQGMDLTNLETLPYANYDLFICTQVFNYIYDVKEAIQGAAYLLKTKGVLLATVAGNISQVSRFDMDRYGHFWGFTYLAIHRLVSDVFGAENVRIVPFGNSMAATAFIQGLSVEDLPDRKLLDFLDEDYAICIGVVAVKA